MTSARGAFGHRLALGGDLFDHAPNSVEQFRLRRTATSRPSSAVLGLRAEVEARFSRFELSSAITISSLGPAIPSIPTPPDHLALCLLDIAVARADDHVHRLHRFGPERQRGDRLCASHRVDVGGAREL